MKTLRKLQRGLETLYRVDTHVSINDFMLDSTQREKLSAERHPEEQLLLSEAVNGDLEIGLFINEPSISNLAKNDPAQRLSNHNMQDFLFAIEGVSHFILSVWSANADRQFSVIELELQAEVDKYITCLLTHSTSPQFSKALRTRLFSRFEFHEDLNSEELERYTVANENARRYSESLEKRFVANHSIDQMLIELRRFYRMSFTQKIDFIRHAV